jgi:hypothetical protein
MVQVLFNDIVLAAYVILRIEVFWDVTMCRLDHGGEDSMVFLKVESHSPNDSRYIPEGPQSSAIPL